MARHHMNGADPRGQRGIDGVRNNRFILPGE
jgi:hypothetical protein